MICRKCNLVSADDAKFCGHCGEPVTPLGAVPPDAAAPRPDHAAASGAATAALAAAADRLPGIIERIKNILMTPKTEWLVIEAEPTTIAQLYSGYVVPLTGLAALMSFIHLSVIGIGIPFGGTFRAPLVNGLAMALVRFGFGLLGLFLVGLIINALAPKFAAQSDQRQAVKTAAYAFTPGLLGSVLALAGGLGGLLQLAAAIYGIYLLYLGLPVMMKGAPEKAAVYTTAVVVCTILLGVLFGLLSATTGGFGGYGSFTYAAPSMGR